MSLPNTAPVVAVPPDADPMEALLRETERRVDERGWDAGNSYQPLIWVPFGDVLGLLVVQRKDPPDAMRYGHPAEVMRVLAEFYAGRGAALLPPDLAGWMVCVEAWMIRAEGAQDEADARAGRIHTRADRVETRVVMARLANGDEGYLVRIRGADDQPDRVEFRHQPSEGEVGAALRELVAACAVGGAR